MTITPAFTAAGYAPEQVRARYVGKWTVDGPFRFCEVGDDRRYDIRQGTVDADDLPESVRLAAEARAGYIPCYVDWPL